MKLLTTLILLCLMLHMSAAVCIAQDQGLRSIGIRMGLPAKTKHEYFHQYEVFSEYTLPWDWRGKSGWGLGLQLNSSAGALHGGKETGFIGTLGPGFSFDKGNKGFAADIGPSVVLLSKRTYGTQDFSGKLQFLIHLGLTYRFDNGLGVGYRIQHMSNAGVYDSLNPGLDLHMATISWTF